MTPVKLCHLDLGPALSPGHASPSCEVQTAYRLRYRARPCRQGLSRPQRCEAASLLHLWSHNLRRVLTWLKALLHSILLARCCAFAIAPRQSPRLLNGRLWDWPPCPQVDQQASPPWTIYISLPPSSQTPPPSSNHLPPPLPPPPPPHTPRSPLLPPPPPPPLPPLSPPPSPPHAHHPFAGDWLPVALAASSANAMGRLAVAPEIAVASTVGPCRSNLKM